MPGIRQWSKNVEVAANPSKRIRIITISTSDEIPGGGNSKTISVFAPDGYISTVKQCYLRYPSISGAASGNHSVALVTGGATTLGITYGQAPYNKDLQYRYGRWDAGTVTVYPEDLPSQFAAQSAAIFDETNDMRVVLRNDTDVTDGGIGKTLIFWVLDEKIGG